MQSISNLEQLCTIEDQFVRERVDILFSNYFIVFNDFRNFRNTAPC